MQLYVHVKKWIANQRFILFLKVFVLVDELTPNIHSVIILFPTLISKNIMKQRTHLLFKKYI